MKDDYWTTWECVQKKVGTELAAKMELCPYLQGIAVIQLPDGKTGIPKIDIQIAYNWAKGRRLPEDSD